MKSIFKTIAILGFIFTCSLLQAKEKPVKMISFVKSAIIPGWGELSQNHKSGYLFLSNEIALFLSYYYFDNQSDLKMKESVMYAYKKAHLSPENNTEEYRLLLSKYMSSGYFSGGYNENIVKTAKSLYPDNPVSQNEYIMENVLPEDVYWNWDSKQDQKKYLLMRKDSNLLKDWTKAASGAILVNHIISAFNAARVTKRPVQFGVDINSDNKPLLSAQYRF